MTPVAEPASGRGVLVVGCLVVRARPGLSTAPASNRIVRIAMWVLTACLAFGALLNFTASTNIERFLIAPFVPALALPALVVAGSGGAWHLHRQQRTLPSH